MDQSTHSNKTGLLLVNLGSPAAPTPEAVKEYLSAFLSDRYVVDYPRWLWLPLLKGIILRTRPARSAALYQRIWTKHGSPLIRITESIARQLEDRLNPTGNRQVVVAAGMRYGQPSIQTQFEHLVSLKVGRLVVLPLFPQYSTTTTQTALDVVEAVVSEIAPGLEMAIVKEYHQHPAYLGALAASIRADWKAHGRPQKLLMSFHGVPKRYCKFDPYAAQCEHTASQLASLLELTDREWAFSFQSRFGPEAWVQPYTEEVLTSWGQAGVKSAAVVAPGFAADCLETIDELGREAKQTFLSSGGEVFRYIPALNDTPQHINALAKIILGEMGDTT